MLCVQDLWKLSVTLNKTKHSHTQILFFTSHQTQNVKTSPSNSVLINNLAQKTQEGNNRKDCIRNGQRVMWSNGEWWWFEKGGNGTEDQNLEIMFTAALFLPRNEKLRCHHFTQFVILVIYVHIRVIFWMRHLSYHTNSLSKKSYLRVKITSVLMLSGWCTSALGASANRKHRFRKAHWHVTIKQFEVRKLKSVGHKHFVPIFPLFVDTLRIPRVCITD